MGRLGACWSRLGASWGRLGNVLRGLGGILRRLGRVMGRLASLPGRLEGFSGRLEGFLVAPKPPRHAARRGIPSLSPPQEAELGIRKGPTNSKTTLGKSINVSMPLGIDFICDIAGFWFPKNGKCASKTLQKTILPSEGLF